MLNIGIMQIYNGFTIQYIGPVQLGAQNQTRFVQTREEIIPALENLLEFIKEAEDNGGTHPSLQQ